MKTNEKAEHQRQLDAAQRWRASRPSPPKKMKPYNNVDEVGIVGAFIVIVSLFIGTATFVVGLVMPATHQSDVTLIMVFLSPVIAGVVGFVIALILSWIFETRYKTQYKRSGWAQYDADLTFWKLVGDEDFGAIAEDNFDVALVLSEVSPSYYRRHIDRDMAKVFGDSISTTLDETAHHVPENSSGVLTERVSSIVMPFQKKIQRSASRTAALKKATQREGKRFLVEQRFPMKMGIATYGSNAIGPAHLTDEEKYQITQWVTGIYQAQGLKVTRCQIGSSGFVDGLHGSWTPLALYVRLA